MLYKPFVKYIILFLFTVGPSIVWGHNPSQSGSLIYQVNDSVWALQVSSALTAYEYEVGHRYGKDSYATPEEFKELVIKLLKDHIHLTFNNGKSVDFTMPIVQLGHETKVTFQVMKVPSVINAIDFTNSSFSNVSRNKNLLVIATRDGTKEKFTLETLNEHHIKLERTENGFSIIKENSFSYINMWTAIIIGMLTVLGIGLLLLKKK